MDFLEKINKYLLIKLLYKKVLQVYHELRGTDRQQLVRKGAPGDCGRSLVSVGGAW